MLTQVGSVATYRQIADVIRSMQRVSIEVENAPDKRKHLRSFTLHEAAGLLGVGVREIRAALRILSLGVRGRVDFAALTRLREALDADGVRLVPQRRPELGEGLATVVFSNFKGGSAKTTTSVHFAQFMALAGYRVLMVDLDSQGSATAQFGIDPSMEVGLGSSFLAWVAARDARTGFDPRSLCRRTYWPSLDLVPAGPVLAEAEDILFRRSQGDGREEVPFFDELNAFLLEVGPAYDVVVVDTRPNVDMLMTVALHAATVLIVPTRATMTDLASTGAYFQHIANYVTQFERDFGQPIATASTRVLITAYDPSDRSQEAFVGLIRKRFGHAVLDGEFLQSKVVGTANFSKETVYEYEPSTDRNSFNRVVGSVNAVNRAIERELQVFWRRVPPAQAAGQGATP